MAKRNVIEAVLRVQARQVKSIIGVLSRIMGMYVRLYYPQAQNSIYGDKDNVRTYDMNNPDFEGRILGIGFFSMETYYSDATVDTYQEEGFFFVDPEFQIPKDTLAMIGYYNETTQTQAQDVLFPYKVQEDMGTYGLDKQLFKRIRLVPIELVPNPTSP